MKSRFLLLSLVLTTLSCTLPLGVVSDKSGAGIMADVLFPEPTTVVKSVVVGTVNVRSCPSKSCGVVGYLYAGQSVVAECSGSWCKIENGWVYAPCLGMKGVCK